MKPFLQSFDDEPKPYSCFISDYRPGESFPPHYHNPLEILLHRGEPSTMRLGAETHDLVDGDVCVIPPNAVHSFRIGPGGRAWMWVIKLSLPRLLALFPRLPAAEAAGLGRSLSSLPPVIDAESSRLRHHIEAISDFSPIPGSLDGRLRDLAHLLELVAELRALPGRPAAPSGSTDQISPSSRLHRILDTLQLMAPSNPGLDEVARACYLSKAQLCRIMKDSTGTTVAKHLDELRLSRAAELLAAGRSVSEAALDCGYPNLSHFIRRFRLRYGQSPKQWSLVRRGVDALGTGDRT